MYDILWVYSWRNLTMLMLSIPKVKDETEEHEVEDISELSDLFR